DPKDSSAPKTVRTSSSAAASANRTAPYRPSWSVSARARRSSRAASSTSSSGVLAPSRKLNAECACNSAYATEERDIRPSSGGWYVARLRDKGPSSAGPAPTDAPAWRGLLSSTRSISAQLGGPLNQPTLAVYRI